MTNYRSQSTQTAGVVAEPSPSRIHMANPCGQTAGIKKPDRYRTTNWSAYNAMLRKCGSLLIWLDNEMARHVPYDGRPGRPPVFMNAARQFCLSIKVSFKLPLMQAVGMVASLFRLAGLDWPVPDYSTLCRRQKTLTVQIPRRRAAETAGGQHRDQVPRRRRAAGPQSWRSRTAPMAQGASGPTLRKGRNDAEPDRIGSHRSR